MVFFITKYLTIEKIQISTKEFILRNDQLKKQQLTNEKVPEMKIGFYDIGDGFFDPKTKALFGYYTSFDKNNSNSR